MHIIVFICISFPSDLTIKSDPNWIMKLKFFLSNYWKSILFICVILYLSFAPPSSFKGAPTFANEDKVVHLILYCVLTCLLIFDFRRYSRYTNTSTLAFLMICLLFPVFLGGAVEIIQPLCFAPRTAEWMDWFSDVSGVLVGWVVMLLITPKFPKESFK